jgi:hypothetical protein
MTYGQRVSRKDFWDSNAFYMKVGHTFVFGSQLGRIGKFITEEKYREGAEYLRNLGELRQKSLDYLTFGRMLRPLQLIQQIPNVRGRYHVFRQKFAVVELPSVLSSVWQSPDGSMAIVLVNVSNQEQEIKFLFDGEKYGLMKSDMYTLSKVTKDGIVEQKVFSESTIQYKAKVAKRNVVIFTIGVK